MEARAVKKLIATCVAVVFALGTAGLAVAQEKKAEEKKSEMKSDAKPAEKKADKKPAAKTANGTVKSAAADNLVVAGKSKGQAVRQLMSQTFSYRINAQ